MGMIWIRKTVSILFFLFWVNAALGTCMYLVAVNYSCIIALLQNLFMHYWILAQTQHILSNRWLLYVNHNGISLIENYHIFWHEQQLFWFIRANMFDFRDISKRMCQSFITFQNVYVSLLYNILAFTVLSICLGHKVESRNLKHS